MSQFTETLPAPAAGIFKPGFDVERIRRDFPILEQTIHGKPLVYLDNAASTQKPREVIDAMAVFMARDYANIHRGIYELSNRATELYEAAREKTRRFLGASSAREIVFLRGATEAINLVAGTFGTKNVGAGDEILITHMEHHSNIVPWQMLCDRVGAHLRVAPINDDGELIFEKFLDLFSDRTRLVAAAHVSNALGTINPVREIITEAHKRGVPVLLDGAQGAPHFPVDVQGLDCDFYVISGHKLFGPTGIGALFAKARLLEDMPPYQGGGDMIESVTFEKTTYKKPPDRFEAGTPNISGAVGLGAALDYLSRLGMENVAEYENHLLQYATERVGGIPGVRLIGTAREKAGVLSFVLSGVHPHDIATILDRDGIAVRAGHHCAQPVMDRFGIPGTARASFAFYNTAEEIDKLVESIGKVKEVLA